MQIFISVPDCQTISIFALCKLNVLTKNVSIFVSTFAAILNGPAAANGWKLSLVRKSEARDYSLRDSEANSGGLNPLILPFWFDNRHMIDIQCGSSHIHRIMPQTVYDTRRMERRAYWPTAGEADLSGSFLVAIVSESGVIELRNLGVEISFRRSSSLVGQQQWRRSRDRGRCGWFSSRLIVRLSIRVALIFDQTICGHIHTSIRTHRFTYIMSIHLLFLQYTCGKKVKSWGGNSEYSFGIFFPRLAFRFRH